MNFISESVWQRACLLGSRILGSRKLGLTGVHDSFIIASHPQLRLPRRCSANGMISTNIGTRTSRDSGFILAGLS